MAEAKLDITVTPDFTKLIEGLESVAATLLEAADKIRALQSPEAALGQGDGQETT